MTALCGQVENMVDNLKLQKGPKDNKYLFFMS